ncbi:FAD-dependent oxidoreductase [Kibdelosporangium phytohabitans]|uniref:Oxidoreductase YetM n=1 Tax=Kibdelosporangium phytohabitans TaxID=860235 RepID=A0A0N9I861_9PSEU|nr:FAD-dependent oxidoreductase [Kibdelosporangium phytohabitans]ALG12068.1 oxidoreductase YetM [Kibdelosporangium phytohabitans]MBE1463554.1 2-polyprenyl-6-methoxyphenol hydroxylase-like FAD-dependent oxidoreductase [Kibdelosporangium phytohabitans]
MHSSDSTRSALIVGAGIAGLTTATALARRGWRVEVVEAGASGATAGWGLSLTGPSLRALDGLGLAGQCLAAGHGMSVITNVDVNGDTNLIELPRLIGDDRPAMAGIARPELHRILRTEALRLGTRIHYGLSVSALRQDGGRTRAELTDGTARAVDLLVGADGIRSGVRDLIGCVAPIRYHGQMVWRARVPRPGWADSIHTFAGESHQTGVVPISRSHAYVFLTENGVPSDVLPDAGLAARMADLLAPFTGRVAEVRPEVARSGSVIRRPVRTALVDASWSDGTTVVIGDAAHAPSPQMASGAALAIEDGLVLTQELDRYADIRAALGAFTDRRRERCSAVVRTSVAIARLEQERRHRDAYPLIDACHQRMAQPA